MQRWAPQNGSPPGAQGTPPGQWRTIRRPIAAFQERRPIQCLFEKPNAQPQLWDHASAWWQKGGAQRAAPDTPASSGALSAGRGEGYCYKHLTRKRRKAGVFSACCAANGPWPGGACRPARRGHRPADDHSRAAPSQPAIETGEYQARRITAALVGRGWLGESKL